MASFTFFGTQNWTVPSDCRSIDVCTATGGGASGVAGGFGAFGSNAGGDGGAGGGGGSYAVSANLPTIPGENLTIYVGGDSGYSGIFSASRGWLVLAYGASGQSGGAPGAYNNAGYNGASGAAGGGHSVTSGGDGGAGGGSPAYGGGGAGGAGATSINAGQVGGAGGGASNYGGGGGGGGGGNALFGGGTGGAGGASFQGIVTLSYTPSFPPTVTAVSPNFGQVAGGQSVVITGTNLTNSVSSISFGGVNSPSFIVNSATQITAITPQHVLGTVDVQVVNAYGTSPISAADKFIYNVTVWSDSAGLGATANIRASVGSVRIGSAGLSGSTILSADISAPQQFISIGLSPAATFATIIFNQPKSLQAGLSVVTGFGGYVGAVKFISTTVLRPALAVAPTAVQQNLIKASLQPVSVFAPFLSQKKILTQFAKMSVEAVIPPLYIARLGLIRKHWPIDTGVAVDILPVQFISAEFDIEAGISPNETLDVLQWINYGSQLLFAEATGLEKAMIDADAPRLTQINAELIVDTWDPYNCPLPLLPYLAWAMGVTFWNDKWSEETKRTWIASQWQFKAFRGTDAAITMAVDFAGRDVSPYGYHVRDIITAPQGQYPSPGISHATQEAWLATLPQVREYLFQDFGQASVDEFYINNSFLNSFESIQRLPAFPSFYAGNFMTPNTAKSRLGKKAIWNVGGQDVANVSVLDFGNYFQLQMPGQAYPEEFYINDAYLQFSYCTPSDAWKRLVTIAPLTQAPYHIAIGPQYQAVEAQPELVTVPGLAGYDVFCGSNFFPHDGAGVFMSPAINQGLGTQLRDPQTSPVFPSFLLPSTSDLRIFYRYSVYDPDLLPTGSTQGTMFCGVGFFDFPPFTAEVDVFMAGTRCPQEFSTGDFMLPSSRYTLPQDNKAIAYVSGAIEAARGLTNLTLLQPKPTPLFSAGKPFICGIDHFLVGQAQVSV